MGVGAGTFFRFVLDSLPGRKEYKSSDQHPPGLRVGTSDGHWGCGRLCGTGAGDQESWDSARRGTCPRAGGQQGFTAPAPELRCARTLVEKYRSLKHPLPPALTPGDAESYMSTEKSCFSLFLFFFIKTTTSYNLKSCP